MPRKKHRSDTLLRGIRALLSVLISSILIYGCQGVFGPVEPATGIAFVSDRDGNWEVYLQQADGTGLTRLTDHPTVDADPAWSPDGRRIAFRSRRDGSSDIFIMNANGSGPRNLIRDPEGSFDDEFNPAWHPDGKTLAIYTDRFPPAQQCRTGAHQLALFPLDGDQDDIRLLGAIPGEQESFAWSPDGNTLVFSSNCNDRYFQLYQWDQVTGQVQQLTRAPYNNTSPAWSVDGTAIAFVSTREDNADVYITELATGELTNLTHHPAGDTSPAWSPDGSQIAFVTNRDGNDEIYIMNVDGSEARNLTQNPADDWSPTWSPVEVP
jgi:TolB protein